MCKYHCPLSDYAVTIRKRSIEPGQPKRYRLNLIDTFYPEPKLLFQAHFASLKLAKAYARICVKLYPPFPLSELARVQYEQRSESKRAA